MAGTSAEADDSDAYDPPGKRPTTQVSALPRLPNATICTEQGWAEATSEYEVSRQILAALKPQARPGAVKQVTVRKAGSPSKSTSSQPMQHPPGAFLVPICSAADAAGVTTESVVDGIFRECPRAEYRQYAQREDRPLILNFIEDYPKILLAQCQHWGTPASIVAPASLPVFDLRTLKPNVHDEFEYHRLEEDYQRLQAQRAAIFACNLAVGPQVNPRKTVLMVMSASYGEYDFANKRYELKTPMVAGAVPLKDYFGSPGPAFDGCVVFVEQEHRWETPFLPLGEQVAEKLRSDNASLIMVVEGHMRFKDRRIGAFTGLGPERSILLDVTKATFIAVPEEGKGLYEVAVISPVILPAVRH